MFLISKNGSSVAEVKQVDMCLEYDKKIIEKANEICDKIMLKSYNYGSAENARNAAREKVAEYFRGEKQICRILVNNKWYFGDYDEVQGKIVFEGIVNALKNENIYFDMRDVVF